MAVALYARVSTAKQAEKDLSIPDQLRQMRDWCKAQGYSVAMEYIEPGASATDDKRPVFQQMISDATLDPAPYEAIIFHSRSRFFRDLFGFLSYERTLKRAGCKIVSITQQTSDDPAGEMASKIFSLFDEYQSKENGKHTLRAMKENTRQGYFNGSRPPFGYRAVETERIGNKGKKKKCVEIDPAEAGTVKRIFDLYLNGLDGRSTGAKEIAIHLNTRNITLRGQQWSKSRVHEVLANTAYINEYYFNKHDKKTKHLKPKSEWVRLEVEPIIEAEIFAEVRSRCAARAPAKIPPKVVGSKTLLTGLLKCGGCGAGMTLATGKSGRFRYYKCNTQIAKGGHLCQSKAVPMQKLDGIVLDALADKVFTPERVKTMLTELKQRQQVMLGNQEAQLRPLQKEFGSIEQETTRLFEAVGKGYLPMDDSLNRHSHKLQARRQEILTAIAGIKRQQQMPLDLLKPKHINAFTKALRIKLLDRDSSFGKEYLRLLVSEIRIEKNAARITGSYAALASAVAEKNRDTVERVPRFVPNWLPDLDSNQRKSHPACLVILRHDTDSELCL
jgi:DNA invertase Pin-like site-specific DNA recombinase